MHKSPKETKERNDQKQQSNKQDTDNKQSKEAKILSGQQSKKQIDSKISARLLSYNIFIRPPPVKNNENDYKDERLKEFIDTEMEKFDIICLQELFRLFSMRRHKMIYSGIKKGFIYHSTSPSPSFFSTFVIDGGLAILSKHPIVKSKFWFYTYGIFSDGACQKGVLYSKILLGNRYLHLFNTHTQASYPTTEIEIKQSVVTRLDQLIEMRAAVEEALIEFEYQSGDICLLSGDFNVDGNHPKRPVSFLSERKDLMEAMEIKDSEEQFDEYDGMITILSGNGRDILIDVIKKGHNGKAQTTFGDIHQNEKGEISPLETALTDKRDLCSIQSLDYIIELIPHGSNASLSSSSNEKLLSKGEKLQIDATQGKVEKFYIKGKKFTQLSDHYGVSSVVNIA